MKFITILRNKEGFNFQVHRKPVGRVEGKTMQMSFVLLKNDENQLAGVR
jgi:hypothetical protein